MVQITTSRASIAARSAERFGEDLDEHGIRQWDYHGDCESPVHMHLAGRPDRIAVDLGIEVDRSLTANMYVRCRKCEPCLAARARLWAARGVSEINAADRSWFGTLTLSPEQATRALYAAMAKAQRSGHDWAAMCPDRRTGAVAEIVGPEITRFLKRVRKNSGATLRYLLVTEAHKTGVPHWHLILHEWDSPARKLVLEQAWRYGFSHWRLVHDPRAAWYACKYLSKSNLTRVRASKDYGRASEARVTERLASAVTLAAAVSRKVREKQVCMKGGPLRVSRRAL